MSKPNPYQISAFNQAALAGSFSRAANQLGVTQSSVTQHVANLERQVGARLFVRRREGLELTRVGRELFELTHRMHTIEQMVQDKIANFGALAEGHLKIVATAPRPAMRIMRAFAAENPGVRLDFAVFNGTTCMEMLLSRQVDVGILASPRRPEGLHLCELSRTRYLAFLRQDHALARRPQVSLRELAEGTVILPGEGTQTWRTVTARVKELELDLRNTMTVESFQMVVEAVLHGIGAGIALEDSCHASGDLAGLPVTDLADSYVDCIVTQSDKRHLRLVDRFLSIALEDADMARGRSRGRA